MPKQEGSVFPNMDLARETYGLPPDATEADIFEAIVKRINQKLGIKGDTIQELTENIRKKTAELEQEAVLSEVAKRYPGKESF